LHGAGAYFNPRIFYNEGSKIKKDHDVMRGVMVCIERMFSYLRIHDKLNMQQVLYKESIDIVGFSSIVRLNDKKVLGKI
jgi:hypothetical protein